MEAARIINPHELIFVDSLILNTSVPSPKIQRFEFPPETKISLRRSRIMSATKVNGRRGTVKETSGFDDWQITIEYDIRLPVYSLLFSEDQEPRNGTFSQDLKDVFGFKEILTEIRDLNLLSLEEERLSVENERLNALDIEYLVISDISFPNNPVYHEQTVRISALSDTEYELVQLSQKPSASLPS